MRILRRYFFTNKKQYLYYIKHLARIPNSTVPVGVAAKACKGCKVYLSVGFMPFVRFF